MALDPDKFDDGFMDMLRRAIGSKPAISSKDYEKPIREAYTTAGRPIEPILDLMHEIEALKMLIVILGVRVYELESIKFPPSSAPIEVFIDERDIKIYDKDKFEYSLNKALDRMGYILTVRVK